MIGTKTGDWDNTVLASQLPAHYEVHWEAHDEIPAGAIIFDVTAFDENGFTAVFAQEDAISSAVFADFCPMFRE